MAMTTPLLRGTLLVRSDHDDWRPRLVELDAHRLIRVLRIADVHHNVAQAEVVLTDRDAWIRVQDASVHPHCFVLKTKDTRILLAATSDDGMWRWIDFLLEHHCASLAGVDDTTRPSLVLWRQSSLDERMTLRESTLDVSQSAHFLPLESDLAALGAEVQRIMTSRLGMQRLSLPHETALSKCHVFVSDGWQRVSKLLLLIGNACPHTPPGIWSRHGCTRLGTERGSMLPYLERAHASGFGTIVLDMGTHSNLFATGHGRVKVPVKGNETPEAHLKYVWTQLLPATTARDVVAIAYGHGGTAVHDFLHLHPPSLTSLRAVAFLDSRHKPEDDVVGRFLRARSVSWERCGTVVAGAPLYKVPPMRRSELFDAQVAGWRLSTGADEDATPLLALPMVLDYLEFCLDVDDDESPGVCSDRWVAMRVN
ncbi:hypothetical protein SPRG_08793 [Saprolegnia parasitica CBS 223.65]|uniref:Arb2 domain-containing protein n=1 Tax=Saprolegnia parasitica (strain CBS 223.65) TaxID=695850 RepID=A0A067C4Z5_SAPPC|nr:hypothetical protein SPRG_08793 [Saprolegnia parasitica CBS 223.65]KDO25849.1 hypothetical protein SPRG_08793 [Saprolegnia parasitica CBS 223.65]|eukprot:XP_012203413.1 hypothetical protein SPRG_08793 [Saprolegnia parasitica CBS 223.65]